MHATIPKRHQSFFVPVQRWVLETWPIGLTSAGSKVHDLSLDAHNCLSEASNRQTLKGTTGVCAMAILLPLQVPLPFQKRRNLIRLNFASGSRFQLSTTKNQNLCGVYTVFRSGSHRSNEKTRLSRHFLSDVRQVDSPPPPFLLVNIFQVAWRNGKKCGIQSSSIPWIF